MTVRSFGLFVVTSLLVACAGESSAPPTPPPAQGWDPVELGRYQDYQVTIGAASPVPSRIQIVAVSDGAFTRRSTTVGSPGYGETTFNLVDGAEYGAERKRYADDGTVQTTDTYAPPYVFFSSDTTAAHVETTVSTITGASTYQSTREVTVDGVETVTVPAGTFTALKTTAHITDTVGTDNYNVNWFADGIGRVKIVTYPTADPANASTWLLTGYGVAAVP